MSKKRKHKQKMRLSFQHLEPRQLLAAVTETPAVTIAGIEQVVVQNVVEPMQQSQTQQERTQEGANQQEPDTGVITVEGTDQPKATGTVTLENGREIGISVRTDTTIQQTIDGKPVVDNDGNPVTATGFIEIEIDSNQGGVQDVHILQFAGEFKTDQNGELIDGGVALVADNVLARDNEFYLDSNPDQGIFFDESDNQIVERSTRSVSVYDRPNLETLEANTTVTTKVVSYVVVDGKIVYELTWNRSFTVVDGEAVSTYGPVTGKQVDQLAGQFNKREFSSGLTFTTEGEQIRVGKPATVTNPFFTEPTAPRPNGDKK